jgi:UDP-glucose 4-epimerase
MNFVLTGHKGLIGSALLERLIVEGHTPVGLVDLRATPSIDIRNLHVCAPTGPVDIVYHLASFCKIRDCIDDPRKAFEHNARGTHSVMEFCAKHNVPKVVFTSSTRVLYPERNAYTASKIYGEELVQSYEGIDWVIVRPSTVYGPFDDKTKRITHEFITRALKNEDLIIYGDRNKTLDFTYIDDFIDALLKASKETNRVFNVGAGRGIRVSDVAHLITTLAGSKSKVIFKEAEKLQPQNVQIDSSDFICPTHIVDGMTKTVEFYYGLYS